MRPTPPRASWIYDARRFPGKNDQVVEIRVLLFPSPDENYPRLSEDLIPCPTTPPTDPYRFELPLLVANTTDDSQPRFLGFLGDATPPDSPPASLKWNENLCFKVYQRQDLLSDPGRVLTDPKWGDVALVDDVTIARILGALESSFFAETHFIDASEFRDPRTWQARPGDAEDPSATLPDIPSPYLKRDSDYDRALALACLPPDLRPGAQLNPPRAASPDDPPQGITSSMLYLELRSLLCNAQARAGENFTRSRVAPNLRAILVFQVPVSMARNVDNSTIVENQLIDITGPIRLAGLSATLTSGWTKPPAFSMSLRPSGQADGATTLVWDCQPIDDQHAPPSIREVYSYIELFRVTRTLLGRAGAKQQIAELRPFWVISADGTKLIRPQHDYTDTDVADLGEGELAEYLVEAVGREGDVLVSSSVLVPRRIVRPVAPPTQCLALHEPATDGTNADLGTLTFLATFSASTAFRGFDLRLLPGMTDLRSLPRSGTRRIVIARVSGLLHIRIFDARGKVVVDTHEERLARQTRPFAEFRKRLADLGSRSELTRAEKDGLIDAVSSLILVGQLQLGYRAVDIQAVGLYGVRPEPGATLQWESGLPEGLQTGREAADVKFARADTERSIPWEEVTLLDPLPGSGWVPVTIEQPGDTGGTFSSESSDTTGYRLVVKEKDLRARLVNVEADQGVQFFVGAQVPPSNGNPLQRSPLIRCRHAVGFPPGAAPTSRIGDGDQVPMSDLLQGATVTALEWIPAQPAPGSIPRFFDPGAADPIIVDYGAENRPTLRELAGTEAPAPVNLRLNWPHTPGLPRSPADPFNPIVGYRVWRADALAPDAGPVDAGSVLARREVVLEAIPWLLYRSTPTSVQPALVRVSPRSPTGARRPMLRTLTSGSPTPRCLCRTRHSARPDLGSATRTRFSRRLPSGCLPTSSATRPRHAAVGKGVLDVICSVLHDELNQTVTPQLFLSEPLDDTAPPLLPASTLKSRFSELLGDSGGRFDPAGDPYGWRFLEAMGLSCQFRLVQDDGQPVPPEVLLGQPPASPDLPARLRDAIKAQVPNCPLALTFHLAEDRSTALYTMRLSYVGPDDLPVIRLDQADFDEYTGKLNTGTVPQKLLTDNPDLVAQLGPDATALQAQPITGDPTTIARGWLILPTSQLSPLPHSGSPQGGIFLVPEGRTPTLFFLRPIRTWNVFNPDPTTSDGLTEVYFDEPIGLRLYGRVHQQPPQRLGPNLGLNDDPGPFSDPSERARFQDRLIRFVIDVQRRGLGASPTLELAPGHLNALVRWPVFSTQVRLDDGPLASRVGLPIQPDGRLRTRLPVADRWAHVDLVAWEFVRRYDAVWDALRNAPAALERVAPVPLTACRRVVIDRSEPLSAPAIVATPLPGSVQAILFKHPSAFAADASALQAARGQSTGQSVVLLRRLPAATRTRLQTVFNTFPVQASASDTAGIWERYRSQWLSDPASNGTQPLEPAPEARVGPKVMPPGSGEIALLTVNGTESALTLADRMVFPDLPGYYYTYRLAAVVTAGRVRSEVALSSDVTVLYDGPARRNDQGLPVTPPEGYRQRPRTFPVRRADYQPASGGNPATIDLAIGLVAPRRHMPPELAPVWVDADETLALPTPGGGAGVDITLGSLPDLALGYLVFFRVPSLGRSGDVAEARPTLRPAFTIIPPLNGTGTGNEYLLNLIDTDLIPPARANGSPSPIPVPVAQASTGELQLLLSFQIKPDSSLILQFDAVPPPRNGATDVRGLTYLAGQRGGIYSELSNEPPPTPSES